VPAVLVTVDAAAAAASGIVLTFDRSSYSGTGCATIASPKVTATSGGTGVAGVSISVTLPSGYTYTDSTTTFTGVTNTSGAVTLPGIVTPVLGGTASLTAVSSGVPAASATMSVAAKNVTAYRGQDGNPTRGNFGSIPAAAVPAGADYFLRPNGDLYFAGSRAMTGVASASGWFSMSSAQSFDYYCDYVLTAGGGGRLRRQTVEATRSSMPVSAVAVGANYALTSGGDLLWDTTVVATGVASAAGWQYYANDGSGWVVSSRCDMVSSSGGAATLTNGSVDATWANVPSNAVAVGAKYFSTSDALVYYQNAVVASEVSSVRGSYMPTGSSSTTLSPGFVADYALTGGGGGSLQNGVTGPSYGSLPDGARAVGVQYFLTDGGTLYRGDSALTSGVGSAAGWFYGHWESGGWVPTTFVDWVPPATC